jgi:chemotaxis methyl-accepting protein methylase
MAAAPVPAGINDVKVRAVRIRPQVVSLISSEDLNIVLQRLSLAQGEAFDLIIATNILVYYDVFEQSLALSNVERMLRPGGFLLSNNALLELPFSQMHSVGYETAVYSDRQGDGDHIVWYQRAAN